MERSDDRCSIAFWNLTGGALSLRINGRDHVLSAGRSLTLDLPRTFAWQVSGRVMFRITNFAYPNAVLSGVFFG